MNFTVNTVTIRNLWKLIMKKYFARIFVLFLLSVSAFAENKIIVRGKYFTTDNLNLRTAPSVHAKKVVTIPKHTAVYVISEGAEEKLDGKKAPWKEIICDRFENNGTHKAGLRGWVFSGYLSEEDKYTDEEIEKILFDSCSFRFGRETVYGFFFENYDDKKTISAFMDADMPGCYESAGETTFHVKDGKIILDKPFENPPDRDWNWANECFYNDDGIYYLTLERVHSTECEFCLQDTFKSAAIQNSLILENGVLISTENVSVVLPSDCVFYSEPKFSSEKVSFPDFIRFENDKRSVLVYNLDRAFRGQKVSASKWLLNLENDKGTSGRWYYLNEICDTDNNPVWIFVPDSQVSSNIEEIPLTVQTFTDAGKKSLIRFRILSPEDVDLISNTHHHMNPWIDSCLDTFPDPKK